MKLISGKWFVNDKEFMLLGEGGLLDAMGEAFDWMGSNTNADAFVKFMIDRKSNNSGEWPVIPLLVEAREKIREGYVPKEIAYPLNRKELMILHYILEGEEECGLEPYGIFFHGIGGSGKTTVCNIFASLFPKGDIAKCAFTELSNSFKRETLAGSRLWYDSDISVHWSDKDANVFKKIITHDDDLFEKKCKNPYTANYRCKALFCCNKPPKFDVSDSGVLRRIVYYHKNEKIANPDPKLARKIYTHDELVDIVCEALLTDISEFYEEFREETQEIIMSGNNVAKYGLDCNYQEYVSRCYAGNIHPFGVDKWEALKELFTEWQTSKNP